MRKTKIVCTIGPATESEKMITKLIKAGMNCARLNLSHGNYEYHKQQFKKIKAISKQLNVPMSVMLDNKGPEIRIKHFENNVVQIENGHQFVLTTREVVGNSHEVSVTLKKFPSLVKPKSKILINDGLIKLVVKSVSNQDVVCKVVAGGVLSNNKSINLPDIILGWDYLKDSAIEDLDLAVELEADYLALSFVSYAKDVIEVREYLQSKGAMNIKLIAKIENAVGVQNIDEILDVCDGVMVARGDLGVEVEYSKIPAIQKEIIAKANIKGKIVITATQMLESMIENVRPTRAEISDVANAVFDGTSAVMLSGETAACKYPIETVNAMDDIVKEAEKNFDYEQRFLNLGNKTNGITDSIAHATANISFGAKCKAIIVATQSGLTATRVSSYLPKNVIIACTPNDYVYNQLALNFGVVPVLIKKVDDVEKLFEIAKECALKNKLVSKGDKVVQTAGVPSLTNATNQLKIVII